MDKQYRTVFVVTEGVKFWTKEFAGNQFQTYPEAYENVIDIFKCYPEITNGIIYSNKGTAISLSRNGGVMKQILK